MTPATQQITIARGERACINCRQYRQCYRDMEVQGEDYRKMVPVSFGFCLLHDRLCKAQRRPCKGFETKEAPRPVGAGRGVRRSRIKNTKESAP